MQAERNDPDRSRPALLAWALYDGATSPFAAIIVSFVFPTYFSRAVVGDEVQATSLWGWMMGLSGLAVALLGPTAGSLADRRGPRKPWIAGLVAAGTLASALLWFVEPRPEAILLALILVGIGNATLELASVFYNAMLPDLASADRIGRWSGLGWGLGYIVGLIALVLLLVLFIQADPPLFDLDREAAEHVRIAGPLCAAFLVVFSLPLLLLCPDRPIRRKAMPIEALRSTAGIRATIALLRSRPDLARFLLAYLLYHDGLTTLFAFGGVYAAFAFGMSVDEVTLFGIALNLSAGIGAGLLGHLDDRIGSRRTIIMALGCLIALGSVAIVTHDKLVFWAAGVSLGLFVGPAQAASRSFMAHLAPADRRAALFGLMAASGRVTAFAGPLLVALVTTVVQSQRAGMAVIVVLLAAGMALLLSVSDAREQH